MRAIMKPGPGEGFALREVPIPRPGPGEILVRMKVAALCGTDLHVVNWDRWAEARIVPPRIFGHEFAGEVVAVGPGGARDISVGDLVTGETHISCGACYYCRTGQRHLCQYGKVIGIDMDGAFADYIVYPAENAWKLEAGVSPEIGAMLNPLGNAVYAVLSTDVAGSSVAVIGCGPIGLYAVMVARAAGASAVFAVDNNAYRLQLARSIGATCCLDPGNVDPSAEILRQTGGVGADIAVEVSGSPGGVETALSAVRGGGAVQLIGFPEDPIPIDLAKRLIGPEIHLRGISGRELYRTYFQAFGLIRGGMDVLAVVTHRLRFAEFGKGIELMRTGQCGKVVLNMEG